MVYQEIEMNNVELELQILKSKIESLEIQQQWLTSNWVDWTKSTKDVGQKLIIALEEKLNNGL